MAAVTAAPSAGQKKVEPAVERTSETPKPEPVKSSARWKVQFSYEKADSSLRITGLKFPSPRRGIAIGQLSQKGRPKPTVLVTADGGAKWDFVELKENAVSLFFLDETLGWLVTDRGIWKTEESGHSWRKLAGLRGILAVCFISPTRGWAVGYPKRVLETRDGGKSWKKLEAAAKARGTQEYTTFQVVEFAGPKAGIIAGVSHPPRRDALEFPAWMDPEGAKAKRQWPNLTVLLQTVNGGDKWVDQATSMFGDVTRMSLSPDGRGLALVEFTDSFDFPSEVHALNLLTGANNVVFRRKDRAVLDVTVVPAGRGYLAAIEPPGSLYHLPVPGRLKMLVSDNLTLWQEMEVDYRASATRAVLAQAGPGQVWVATDTGMILKLGE